MAALAMVFRKHGASTPADDISHPWLSKLSLPPHPISRLCYFSFHTSTLKIETDVQEIPKNCTNARLQWKGLLEKMCSDKWFERKKRASTLLISGAKADRESWQSSVENCNWLCLPAQSSSFFGIFMF